MKTMTPDQIDKLAQEALNAAALLIQKRLGVPAGDYAALFFSGDETLANLKDYIAGELAQNYEPMPEAPKEYLVTQSQLTAFSEAGSALMALAEWPTLSREAGDIATRKANVAHDAFIDVMDANKG